jgi:hypothetical protein
VGTVLGYLADVAAYEEPSAMGQLLQESGLADGPLTWRVRAAILGGGGGGREVAAIAAAKRELGEAVNYGQIKVGGQRQGRAGGCGSRDEGARGWGQGDGGKRGACLPAALCSVTALA